MDRVNRRLLNGLVAAFALLVVVPAAHAAPTIMWETPYSCSPDCFHTGNLDGSSTSIGTINTTGATVTAPWGMAFDPAAGKVYWANYGVGSGNKISWANLDGSGGGDLNTGTASVAAPSGLVVDHVNGKVYWANTGDANHPVSWAMLDNSGTGGDLNKGTAPVSDPIGVAIDQASGKIFWANYGGNSIGFAKLDNSGGGPLNITGTTVSDPWGVAIDTAHNKLFWGNFTTNSLDFANLDGTGGGVLSTPGAPQTGGPMVGAIDPTNGKIYWTDWNSSTVMEANVDGSGDGHTLYTQPGAAQVAFGAIMDSPTPQGAPAIAASSSLTPASLSCSAGSWGADLVGEQLYRAPATLAYQWFVNGNLIGGATSPNFAATGPGSYTCAVVATNYAGSAGQTSAPVAIASPPGDKDHDGITDNLDKCPTVPAGKFDSNHDGCPGPYQVLKISTVGGWTVSDTGVSIRTMSVHGVHKGTKVLLVCAACHIRQTLTSKGTSLSLKKLKHKLLRRNKSFTVTATEPGFIGDALTLKVKNYGHKHSDLVRASGAPFKAKHACLPAGSSKTAKSCSTTPPTGP